MFGFGGPKAVVGLDIGSSAVKAVELKAVGKGFKVTAFATEPVPPDSIVDGAITDGVAVAEAIRRLFAHTTFKTKLAEIHRRRGQTGEALAVYQRALLLAKNDPDLQQAVRSLTQELAAVPGPDRAPELRAESAPATPLLAAARAVAALEQFLAAIHVARAQPRA